MVTSTRSKKVLELIRPGGDPDDEVRWQQRKSSLTREAILEAAIDCLVSSGYTGLTTIEVAKRAGVSRGAMHHHYASRMELVAALVEYVLYRRMRHFLEEYPLLPQDEEGEFTLEQATELYWRTLQQREFTAYLELAMAARTDPELERELIPAARRFDAIWTREMAEAFPQWGDRIHLMKLASDFAQAAHLGLLFNTPVIGEERHNAVRDLIVRMVDMVYRGEAGARQDDGRDAL
jgi:AcrR family transcriptional regulator